MTKTYIIFLLLLLSLSPPLLADKLTTSSVMDMLYEKYEEINYYNCLIDTFEKKGRKINIRTLDYHFLKPEYIYIKILEGKNTGGTVLFKDDKVKASRGGILSKFRILFKPTDKMVLSIRGSRIDQSGWGYALEQINEMIRNDWKHTLTEKKEEDSTKWVIELSSSTNNTGRLYRYTVDPGEKLIVQSEYYENEEMLSKSKYKSIKINVEYDDNLFK